MKKILLVTDLLIPSVILGLIKPYLELEKEKKIKLRIKKSSAISNSDITWCDIGVFCRAQSESEYKILLRLKQNSKKVIYDIDDNFFEIPVNTRIGRYHGSSRSLFNLEMFLQLSDMVVVYSGIFFNRVKKYTENVVLIKSYFDSSLLENCSKNDGFEKVRIAYATGRAADPRVEGNLEMALVEICKKYGEEIELHFWRKPSDALNVFSCVKLNPIVPNYNVFVRSFYKKAFDIGLAPLVDDAFYNSKTNNKYREYGGCGVAGVYSDVPVYRENIEHKKNGLLVKNNTKADWFESIEELILNHPLRKKIAEKAEKDVKENYRFSDSVNTWATLLEEVKVKSTLAGHDSPYIKKRNSKLKRFPLSVYRLGERMDEDVSAVLERIIQPGCELDIENEGFTKHAINLIVLHEYKSQYLDELYMKSSGQLPMILCLLDIGIDEQELVIQRACEIGLKNAIILMKGESDKAVELRYKYGLMVMMFSDDIVSSELGLNSNAYARVVMEEAVFRLEACMQLVDRSMLKKLISYPYMNVWNRIFARLKTELLYYKLSKLKKL